MTVLGDERQRRRDLVRREAAELLGRVGDELAVQPEQIPGLVQLVEHRPAVDVLDRAEPELERRHDTEVAATTPDRPEEVRVVLVAGDVEGAVPGDHVRRQQVVQSQPQPPREVADATAEGQAADAGGRDDAARSWPVRTGTPRRSGRPRSRRPRPGPSGSAGPHGHRAWPTGRRPRPRRRCRSPGRCGRHHGRRLSSSLSAAKRTAVITSPALTGSDDDGRTPVDHAVADLPRVVVPVVIGSGDGPPDPLAQRVQL